MTTQPTILHITGDYPDCVSQLTTHAVYNLIKQATPLNHMVYSLNRTSRATRIRFIKDATCTAVTYPGLPFGVGLRPSLRHLGQAIGDHLQHDPPFDVIHAHKFTIEGIVADAISQRYRKPMIATVRGETDLRILRLKPSYRTHYINMIDRCCALCFLAPWTKRQLTRQSGMDLDRKAVMLPNITTTDERAAPQAPEYSHRFLTACRFDAKNFINKRIATTVRAFNLAAEVLPDISLDIAGSGISPQRTKLLRLIASLAHGDRIRLIAPLVNSAFCQSLPHYAAFVRPSYPETFGMVFLESLFAGVPVLFARETAIDGYLSDAPFALAVDHRSTAAIAEGIVSLECNQMKLKRELGRYLVDGKLDGFRKLRIISTYKDIIGAAIASSADHLP